jgi:hypothetical protein
LLLLLLHWFQLRPQWYQYSSSYVREQCVAIGLLYSSTYDNSQRKIVVTYNIGCCGIILIILVGTQELTTTIRSACTSYITSIKLAFLGQTPVLLLHFLDKQQHILVLLYAL